MNIDIPVEYQVFLGSLIGGLILTLFRFIISYRKESKREGESQALAITSIIIGLIVFIPFAGVLGLMLAVPSFFMKKMKALSKIAIVINLIALIPWIAVLIFGP